MFSAKELSTNERDLTTIQSARYRSAGSRYDCHCHTVSPVCMWRLKQAIFPRRSLKQRCPWIGFIHGLDWIGLGPMTVVYKILTAYVFRETDRDCSM